MQPSDNMKPDTAETISASSPVDIRYLIKNWPARVGADDVFNQDALLDEGVALLRLCCDWITERYTNRGLAVPDPNNPLDAHHPLVQAQVFLRQFDDPSSPPNTK